MSTSSAVRFSIPRDVWIGLLAAGGAVAYWRVADDIPISPLDGAVNATVLPKALAGAMVIFSLLLIVRALIVEAVAVRAARAALAQTLALVPDAQASAEASGGTANNAGDETGAPKDWRRHLKASGVLAIGVAYLLLLPVLGYVLSIFLLVLSMSVYIGARPGPRPVAVAALVAGAFYLLFRQVLGIPMPAGILAGLLG